jgi:hypothetical protein
VIAFTGLLLAATGRVNKRRQLRINATERNTTLTEAPTEPAAIRKPLDLYKADPIMRSGKAATSAGGP